MDLEIALQRRSRVEEFLRKHDIGLLTLMFSDIAGSTQLKQELGDQQAVLMIQRHHQTVRELLAGFPDGEEISVAGDSFFIVFARPSDAVKFALVLQAKLHSPSAEFKRTLWDRIGIHVGEVHIEHSDGARSNDLYGIHVDIAARIMSLAQPQQVLMSRFAFDSARQVLKGQDTPGLHPLSWLNHGLYRLKGVNEPIEICEAGEIQLAPLAAPPSSEKAQRHVSGENEQVLGWRPALEQEVPNTPWVLERKLGEGGFGEVWLGRHRSLKEHRVFKFCFRADRIRYLKREVTIFRLLKERVGQHPNIVGVQDLFFDEPPFYIVMDYAEGRDLPAWCEAQGGIAKVPMAARLEITAQIADALQAAHAAGVVHRDIKPSNIIVSSKNGRDLEPHAKLSDFGIGQVLAAESLAGITRAGFTQTVASSSSSSNAGSQMYMAPELLTGAPASARSDIFSLGVVLYQLLSGTWSPLTTDWERSVPDPLLRDILKKCFSGDPKDRFADAGRLAKELRSVERRWQIQRLIGSAAVAIVTTVVTLLISVSFVGDRLGFLSYDLLTRIKKAAPATQVVIVGIDQASVQQLKQPFPWNRSMHARLLEKLADAKAVTFDLVFADQNPKRSAGDSLFAKAIKEHGKVVLAASETIQNLADGEQRVSTLLPVEMFRESAASMGVVNVIVNNDGVARNLPVKSLHDLPSLAIATAKLTSGNASAQLNELTDPWLNFYGPPGTIPHVSYYQAVGSNTLSADFFRDKVVLVGPFELGPAENLFHDQFGSPYGRGTMGNRFPGTEIHATALLNLLRHEWINRLSGSKQLTLIILTGFLFGFSPRFVRKSIAAASALLGIIIVLVSAWLLFKYHLLWFPWLILVLEILLAFSLFAFTSAFGHFSIEKRPDGLLVGYIIRRRRDGANSA